MSGGGDAFRAGYFQNRPRHGTPECPCLLCQSVVEWPHTATLDTEVEGQTVRKDYRWRFEADLDAYDQPRIVAQHRRFPGGWCSVRNPDRLAQLRALSAVNPAGAEPVEGTST